MTPDIPNVTAMSRRSPKAIADAVKQGIPVDVAMMTTQQVTKEAMRLVEPTELLKMLVRTPKEPADPSLYADPAHPDLATNVAGWKEMMMRRIVAADRLRGPAQQAMLNSIQRLRNWEWKNTTKTPETTETP
jgi:hypothetical protein